MIKTILIDDEDDARLTLRSFLSSYCPDVSIVAEADGVSAAFEAILKHSPDLVFLDIQMEDGSGFDLLERLKETDFSLVFTTAFDSFAIKAFKYSAIDYLLKPIDPDELVEAVRKSRKKFSQRSLQVEQLLKFQRGEQLERITISSSEGLTMVRLDDIIRLESDSNYTHFFLKTGEKITVPKSLKEYEDLLPTDKFFRIHQSHIVNLNHVKKYIKDDGGYVLMEDGSQAYVARRRKDEFLQILTGS